MAAQTEAGRQAQQSNGSVSGLPPEAAVYSREGLPSESVLPGTALMGLPSDVLGRSSLFGPKASLRTSSDSQQEESCSPREDDKGSPVPLYLYTLPTSLGILNSPRMAEILCDPVPRLALATPWPFTGI